MQKYELLCKSANDKKIVFDPINSHTATHFSDAPKLRSLAEELLGNMALEGDLIAKDFDIGRVIGDSDVVEINESDEIVYAIRKSREDQGYVPFTKSRPTQPSQMISIYLLRKDNETYELSSIWIGEFESPMFPQMENSTEDSIPYWGKHAFVWGSQEIIPGTEITKRPW
ncbi:MAG: hypothetical protein AAB971_03565 [Patescibacteria group bacterium]